MTDEKNDSLLSRLIRWLDDLLFYEDEEDEDYDVHDDDTEDDEE